MIEVSNLSKRYGAITAIDHVSFKVDKGEIIGFLGPNGAGKSTTMNIITGYISATAGYVRIDGYDVMENPEQTKRRIGYLPEQPPLYPDMTVKEYLDFICDLKNVRKDRRKALEEICEQVRIADVYKRLIRNLSKGYKQRVGIAQALIGNPDVLILDEPTVGLDPKQIIEIRDLIKKLGERRTVILSSHILSEIQAVCERVIIISSGKLVADGRAEELSAKLSDDHDVQIRVEGPEEIVFQTLSKVHGVKSVRKLGKREEGSFDYLIEPKEKTDVRRALFNRMAEKKYPILSMSSNQLTLEDVFLKLTTGDYDGGLSEFTPEIPGKDNAAEAPESGTEAAAAESEQEGSDKA
ncbi:MAG: ABC transporter ATP-binding protein [Oscillospiraceae bacterium]|jgi:ABC-2 type transport system ATP-binding protein|nr:ABC transporter ATP-binding protein [Oscillospiraceae bacterium]